MIGKRNVAIVAIVSIVLTFGAAGIVTSIGQVAHAQNLAEYGILTGHISSHHTPAPGFIIKNIHRNSDDSGGGSGDSGSAAGGK